MRPAYFFFAVPPPRIARAWPSEITKRPLDADFLRAFPTADAFDFPDTFTVRAMALMLLVLEPVEDVD